MRYPAAVVALAFGLALTAPGLAAGKSPESERLYQDGLNKYARGDLPAALASFREGLRLEPNDRSALTAVLRLESELAARPAPVRRLPEKSARRRSSGRLDRFLLVSVPRWYHFERTIGDPLSDVGTLNALNARVVQLLGEKKLAEAKDRRFVKDRELRALLRRLPVAAHQQGGNG